MASLPKVKYPKMFVPDATRMNHIVYTPTGMAYNVDEETYQMVCKQKPSVKTPMADAEIEEPEALLTDEQIDAMVANFDPKEHKDFKTAEEFQDYLLAEREEQRAS